jgi:DNA invertase Pin-like site-specific DNA recombinase
MERIGKLKADVQAVSDLVTSKGWTTLEDFLREAGYVKSASKGRAGKSGNAGGTTRKRLTKDEKKELERLLKAGAMTVREIADKFSVSQTTVMVTKSKLGLVKKRG